VWLSVVICQRQVGAYSEYICVAVGYGLSVSGTGIF
jgi:hypothetical protein